MKTGKPFHPARQRGVSLIVTLMIVVLLSLLGLYGAGVLVLDTRSAANDFRARQAMAAAEAGTEQGLSLLNANRKRITVSGLDLNNDGTVDNAWTPCGSEAWCLAVRSDDRANWQFLTVTGLASQPNEGSFSLHLLTPLPDADPDKINGSRLVYNVVAIGTSADGTSTATLKQGAYYYPILLGRVSTPLAAGSTVPLNGNYSIITNSDSASDGSNLPVSAWSNGSITPSGSFATCHIGDFDTGANGCPSASAISKVGQIGEDLVTDPDFPTDLFEFLFGLPASEYQKVKEDAEVVANCDGLGPASTGLIWVTGNCNLPNRDVGSTENPVFLVVEGAVTANGSYHFYGLIYLFNLASGTASAMFNGGYTIHGSLFVHNTMSLNLSGTFVLGFDKEVLGNLNNGPSARALARIPGVWSDVQ
ncbi:MAG: pilus assembly PilX N-terminal domain-containing protein [Thiobacillus sp.]|jgi:type II secretory pathway pseudopilin PulG|uniref:pilus assembly PilX family protein n=1 Tax=Thiobacillus sp. TaxID=924 RepID=UPI002894FAA8|nr:pilus assembly PilX N-terminal domain-containing protein [Thiobacillus sp.]MDT3705244.1 pilus assembly PilX N-terminal domain-containing protein [Thiobacillus sp.]